MASTTSAPDGAPDAARHLLFEVGGRLYGCAIGVVREIVPFQRCTRLPGAPADVCGLINLRGTVVTVLDLGVRLAGVPVDPASASVVLVEDGSRLVGLAVSQLRDVQQLAAQPLGAPSAGAGEWLGTAVGIARSGDSVVVLLDAGAIIRQTLV